MQLAPRRVGTDLPGKSGQARQLDAVRQRDRLTSPRNQYEDPARAETGGADEPLRDGVESMEIEQQPAVDLEIGDGGPDCA